jgi:ribosome-associated protein
MSKSTEKQLLIDKIVEAIQDTKGEDSDFRFIRHRKFSSRYIYHLQWKLKYSGFCNCRQYRKKVRNDIKERPWHVEGTENAMWVLVDYVSVVVHVFQRQIREYYDIEELWGDAKITKVES